MDIEVKVAVISAFVALISAGISVRGQMRLARFHAKKQAEAILAKYREPLLRAAYELQSKIYNIVRQNLLKVYYVNGSDAEKEYALQNTLYVIAQYFGWTEILRREIQFLDLGEVRATRKIARLQENICHLFLLDSDSLGRRFRIFRGEQRAIGECMITNDPNGSSCTGYAAFVQQQDPAFRKWFDRLGMDIDELAQASEPYSARLVMIQRALIDLIDFLDKKHVRFPKEYRKKLPMPIDAHKLSKDMLTAMRDVLKPKWPEIGDYAEGEVKKFAESLVMIEKLKLEGKIDEEQAKMHLDIQKNTARSVLLTVEGVGIASTEMAINRALKSVQDYVNTATGWKLIKEPARRWRGLKHIIRDKKIKQMR